MFGASIDVCGLVIPGLPCEFHGGGRTCLADRKERELQWTQRIALQIPGELLCGTHFETCLDVDMDVRHAQT